MAENATYAPVFEFTGNLLCLDFSNTVHDRDTSPRELLTSYSDLVFWSEQAHILPETDVQQLLSEAEQHAIEASQVHKRAITLREAIFRIFAAIAEENSPAEGDLSILNAELSRLMTQARIVADGEGFVWDWSGSSAKLDRMLLPVVQSVTEVLTTDQLNGVRICAADDCNWLFLDTSKNHSRRWCDMKSCGNRAKARRHYGRKKTQTVDA